MNISGVFFYSSTFRHSDDFDLGTEELSEILNKIHESGITIFIVEHDMKLVMGVCQVITVIDYGKKIAEGDCDCVRANPRVIEAYLGKEEGLC